MAMRKSRYHLHSFHKIVTNGVWTLCLALVLVPLTSSGSGSQGIFFESTEQRYETGKYVFHRKLVCDQCPYRDYDFTAPDAADILPELQSDGDIGRTLGVVDRKALAYFLIKRFGIHAGT
jgi:hypothetical protein